MEIPKEKYETMVIAIADLAHKHLRQNHYAVNGNTPHIKITKDTAWIKKHGTNEADTVVLDYVDLPSDWQKERTVGAQIALDAILDAAKKLQKFDERFIERTADTLHRKWLERNEHRATEIQKYSYGKLPETEKEKDRVFARAAIEVYTTTH